MTVKDPLVSVIMNCYNGERFLKDAIYSVYVQTFPDWEIIFWDNASTDSSGEIAQSYDERVKYFIAPSTTPLGEARNLALMKATGKYIAFLDCDDSWLPEKLEKQIFKIQQNDLDVVYGPVNIIDANTQVVGKTTVQKKPSFVTLLTNYDINMQSALIRRDACSSGLNKNLSYCPDYELFLRIASEGKRFGTIENRYVNYRVHDSSLSNKLVALQLPEALSVIDSIECMSERGEAVMFSEARRYLKLTLGARERISKRKYMNASCYLFLAGKYKKSNYLKSLLLLFPYLRDKVIN